MSRQLSNYVALPRLALAHGDSTPDPGKIGALAWSTTLSVVMSWNGGYWQGPVAFYDLPTSYTYVRPKYDVGRGVKLLNLEGGGGGITLAANLVQGTGISITGTDTLTITNTKPGAQTALITPQSTTTTTLGNVNNSGFTVSADKKYKFKYSINWEAAQTTSGISLALNGPAASGGSLAIRTKIFGGPGGGTTESFQRVYDTKVTLASCDVANTACYAEVEGVLWVGGSGGTLTLRYACTTAAVSATIKYGSIGELYELGP